MQFAIIGIILFTVIHSKVTLLMILCIEKVLIVLLNEPLKMGKSTVPKIHLHINVYKFPLTDLWVELNIFFSMYPCLLLLCTWILILLKKRILNWSENAGLKILQWILNVQIKRRNIGNILEGVYPTYPIDTQWV